MIIMSLISSRNRYIQSWLLFQDNQDNAWRIGRAKCTIQNHALTRSKIRVKGTIRNNVSQEYSLRELLNPCACCALSKIVVGNVYMFGLYEFIVWLLFRFSRDIIRATLWWCSFRAFRHTIFMLSYLIYIYWNNVVNHSQRIKSVHLHKLTTV